MKNCEFLLKKKIPFEKINTDAEVITDQELANVQYHYWFTYDKNRLGDITVYETLPNGKALLYWLQRDHNVLNESEKELVKRAVSDLGRLNDRDIYVRWYLSQPRDHVLEIGEDYKCGAYDKHDILWRMKLTDTGFEFNDMLQDQRYSLKELGI